MATKGRIYRFYLLQRDEKVRNANITSDERYNSDYVIFGRTYTNGAKAKSHISLLP